MARVAASIAPTSGFGSALGLGDLGTVVVGTIDLTRTEPDSWFSVLDTCA